MRVAELVLLHFSDVNLSEEAINEVEVHREQGPRKRNAQWKKSQVVREGIGPLSRVVKLIIDLANDYSPALLV